MSNILKVWTPEAQQKLLDAIEERLTFYADEVKPGQRKRKDAADLFWRGKMLTAAGRRGGGETIYVPCLGNFAWDLWDLGRCLAAAKECRATVVALNTGLRIPPGADDATMKQAREDFAADKRRGAVQPGRLGREIATEQRLADTRRRIKLIEPDWGNPKYSQAELLERAGSTTKRGNFRPMSWKTARLFLPNRQRLLKQKENSAKARNRRIRDE